MHHFVKRISQDHDLVHRLFVLPMQLDEISGLFACRVLPVMVYPDGVEDPMGTAWQLLDPMNQGGIRLGTPRKVQRGGKSAEAWF